MKARGIKSLGAAAARARWAKPPGSGIQRRQRGRKPATLAKQRWKALSEWRKACDAKALANLEDAREPPPGADFLNPWWLGVLTSTPEYIDERGRQRCEMLIGLPPQGACAPDWPEIHARAARIFNRDRGHRGGGKAMRLLASPGLDRERGVGVSSMAIPCFGRSNVRGIKEWLRFFDRRRAAKRNGLASPGSWTEKWGSLGERLWTLGASRTRLDEATFDQWPSAVASAAQALLEGGALRAQRCPGFFSAFPSAMEDPVLLNRIGAEVLDPLRQRWAMQAASSSAAPAERRSSL